MENGILRNFFKGKFRFPHERKAPLDCERQKELVRLIDETEKYFTDRMDEVDLERWKSLKVMQDELDLLNEADLFAYSFAMGFMWVVDVMREADDFIECDGGKE